MPPPPPKALPPMRPPERAASAEGAAAARACWKEGEKGKEEEDKEEHERKRAFLFNESTCPLRPPHSVRFSSPLSSHQRKKQQTHHDHHQRKAHEARREASDSALHRIGFVVLFLRSRRRHRPTFSDPEARASAHLLGATQWLQHGEGRIKLRGTVRRGTRCQKASLRGRRRQRRSRSSRPRRRRRSGRHRQRRCCCCCSRPRCCWPAA